MEEFYVQRHDKDTVPHIQSHEVRSWGEVYYMRGNKNIGDNKIQPWPGNGCLK